MITGIEHIAIFSNDTARLKDWYIEMFDFKQVYDNGKGTFFLKAQNGAMIEFVSTDRGEIPPDHLLKGLRHIAISTDDLPGTADKLKAAGVEVISEPVIFAGGIGTFFFRDPDGNALHLILRPDQL